MLQWLEIRKVEMTEERPPNPSRSPAWPIAIAVTVVAVVAIVAATVIYVFSSLARIPGAAVDQTKEVLESVQDLAQAFRQGTVEERFMTYATRTSGSTYLQIASVDRTEVFTREDRASIFWGTVPLPDVVVSATAPVRYTAYVDLDRPWHLRLEGDTLTVDAPPIEFNRPAIDASQIEWTVEEGSLLRDEDAAFADLKAGLTSMTHHRTQELEDLVRETARSRIEDFVRAWLLQSFAETEGVDIEVTLGDETPPTAPVLVNRPE